ncbi:MAG: ParB/RepB/Spo0J family partition protein [Bacilli bacterium]|nr:ParB/RepB/Spo0J family partition protein [Bacilli bacterium]
MNLEKEIFDIALQDLIPNRFQPREIFNDKELSELADSIKQHGVIQPIIVRKVGDKYEIIAGERRFRASQLAGKETIPALVRDIDDKEAAKIALLENLQRSNLTPIEEAKTYQTILKIDNITQDELANNLGRSQSTIANKLRLLTLAEEVQTALLNSQISERHARSLLGLTNEQQVALLHKTIEEKLTVRQLDEEIMKLTGRAPENNEVDYTLAEGETNMNNNFPNMNNTIGVSQVTMPNNVNTESPVITENNVPVEPVINIPTVDIPPAVEENVQPVNEVFQPAPENNNPIENTPNTEVVAPPTIEMPVMDNNLNPLPEATETNVIEENPQEEPIMEQPITEPVIEPNSNEPTVEQRPQITEAGNNEPQVAAAREENIFDKLRVTREETEQENKFDLKTPDLNMVIENQINSQEEQQTDMYDMRFAINNFRQAVQNTEKFGFKVNTTENDLGDKYQLIIEIDKK